MEPLYSVRIHLNAHVAYYNCFTIFSTSPFFLVSNTCTWQERDSPFGKSRVLIRWSLMTPSPNSRSSTISASATIRGDFAWKYCTRVSKRIFRKTNTLHLKLPGDWLQLTQISKKQINDPFFKKRKLFTPIQSLLPLQKAQSSHVLLRFLGPRSGILNKEGLHPLQKFWRWKILVCFCVMWRPSFVYPVCYPVPFRLTTRLYLQVQEELRGVSRINNISASSSAFKRLAAMNAIFICMPDTEH